MRLLPVIAAIFFGVAMNYVAAWFCVQRHQAARDNFLAKRQAEHPNWITWYRRDTPDPLEKWELSKVWLASVPEGWPAEPEFAKAEGFGRVTSSSAAAYSPGSNQSGILRSMSRVDAGWPLQSVWHSTLLEMQCSSPSPSRLPIVSQDRWAIRLPYRYGGYLGLTSLPIGIRPFPFLANTAFYAIFALLTLAALGAIKRRHRSRLHLCPTCAYPIGTSPVCTECGRPVRTT